MWEHHLSNIVDCDIRKGGEGPDEPDWNASMEKILNDLGVGREGANGPLCFSRWRKFTDYPRVNDIVKSKEHLKLQCASLKFGDGEILITMQLKARLWKTYYTRSLSFPLRSAVFSLFVSELPFIEPHYIRMCSLPS